MNDDNAARRVIQELRAHVTAAAPGARLPSVRDLMARHHISPVTAQRAIRRLASEGLVEVRPGKGSYVAARVTGVTEVADLSWQAVALGERRSGEDALPELLAMPRPELIALTAGYLDASLQPVNALGAALSRAARRPSAWERGPVEGRVELRAWFARQAGGALRAGDMVVCPGGQSGLGTALRALCVPGDTVLVEAPTYLGVMAAARTFGLRVVGVPVDADGVRPDLLAAAFERTGAKVFYCQPAYANPHGAILAPHRRAEVLAAARAARAFILEDDWARDLVLEGEHPPPLVAEDLHGHVVHLRSLTKAGAPGLRVAAIGARGAAGARIRSARVADDFFVSGPLQEAALEFVASPAWARHQRTLRTELLARRDALLSALAQHLPEFTLAVVPRGGLHLWARLPDGVDDQALTTAAAAHGVVVFPGRPWYPAEPPAPHLRLTFGAAAPEVLGEGVRRLAAAYATLR
ncbi:aminotransferase-like domain-containing protein [Crossiella cryophila]|uniref:DNA-binding transcriptional MocR family regulator n=1 Tax=Crossiella cryophila TaxID=43355 RepID=A0A7W7FU84_9PSEU|nr:PLP-dependent aminotransferase family protein [Crossiella cryophila]MBB4677992.1 DNA-binding transcriptional MocR family regulator [Crossiella cryophila]